MGKNLAYSRLKEQNFPFDAELDYFLKRSENKNKKEVPMGTITSITIVYKKGDSETCYCLEDKNIKKAGLFLNRASKGDFRGWREVCSNH